MNSRLLTFSTGLIFSLVCSIAQAETLTGWVTQIEDGDTVTIKDYSNQQHQVHLKGIDAPEKYQPYGKHSLQILGALINGRDVAVEWNKRDSDGRIVGKVMIAPDSAPCHKQRDCPKTLDVGLEQIRTGQAWWDKNTPREQESGDQSRYQRAEFEAKIHRRGLWADTNPVAPWDFKRYIK